MSREPPGDEQEESATDHARERTSGPQDRSGIDGALSPLWIFGYGSLVWRPAFDFVERRSAFMRGYARRFWQGSTDHRGVPGAPGRVVTLAEEPGSRCWGVAYRAPDEQRAAILERLDHREQGGYERRSVTLWLGDPRDEEDDAVPVEGLVYIATPANPNYLGAAALDHIVDQVLRSAGPSGANPDYVLHLARALRELGVGEQEEEHVFELERRVRAELGY